MAKQISKDKKQISIVLTLDQIKRLDGRATELGTSRAALISEAVDALLGSGDGTGQSVDSIKLDAVMSKLDALASAQDAFKAQQLAQVAVIVDAVKNQPIAVQQLPAAEPAEPEPAPRRGIVAMLFGRK